MLLVIAYLSNLIIVNKFVHVMKIVNVAIVVPVIMEKFNGKQSPSIVYIAKVLDRS